MPLYQKRPFGVDFSAMPEAELAALQAEWDSRWGQYTGDWRVVEGLPFPVSYREIDGVQTPIMCFNPLAPTDWPGCSALRIDQITDIHPRQTAAYHAKLWSDYLNGTGGIKFVSRELLIADGLLNEQGQRASFAATPAGGTVPQEGVDRWGLINIVPGKEVATNEQTGGRWLKGVTPSGPLPPMPGQPQPGPMGEPFRPDGPLPGPDSGNEPPVGGEPNAPAGCEGKICSCINSSSEAIAGVLEKIAEALNQMVNRPIDTADRCKSCVDAYIAGLLQKPKLTCEQCRSQAMYGMAGTVEWAVQCAHNACSPYGNPPYTPPYGNPPYTPGNPPYVPPGTPQIPPGEPEEPPEEEHTYTGWCSSATGVIYVTKTEDGPPAPGVVKVASGNDETAVATEAAKNCQPFATYPQSSPGSLNSPSILNPPGCQIAGYNDLNVLFGSLSAGTNLNTAGAISQAMNAALEFGIGGLNVMDVADVLLGPIRAQTAGVPHAAAKIVPHLSAALGCDNPIFKEVIGLLANVGMIEKFIGVDLNEYLYHYHYAANLSCRQKFLLPDDATKAFLTNAIDHKTADRLWGMHGFCSEPLDWHIHSHKARPTQLELAHLRRRGLISQSEYGTTMRELGFLEPQTGEKLYKLSEQLPTLSDIIRLMVRDTDDDTLPDWPDSDRLFAQKYGAQLRQWAEMQGVPEQFAKYAWRAHWTIPPPTALFQFWHRLRHNPAFGTPDEQLAAIKQALIQQDILPRWHKHYLETAYRILSRVDLRRMFNIGQLTEADVTLAYTKQGYSDDDAARLTKFAVQLRNDAIIAHRHVKQWLKGQIDRDKATARLTAKGFPAKAIETALAEAVAGFDAGQAAKLFVSGYLTRPGLIASLGKLGVTAAEAGEIADRLAYRVVKSPRLGEYSVGLVGRADAAAGLANDGLDPLVANKLLGDIDSSLKQSRAAACERGVKRRFLLGDVNDADAIAHLGKFGINAQHATDAVAAWNCERFATGKQIPATKLCGWLARGAITPVDFTRRLQNIGYTQDDANRMLEDCLISINARRLAEAKRMAKEQAAEAARAEAAARRADAAAAREAAAIKRRNDAAAKARLAREKQLFSAIDKMTDKCECDTLAAKQFLTGEKQRLERDYGLTVDESLATLIASIEEWAGGEAATLTPVITMFAEAAYIVEADSSTQEPFDPAIINGVTQPSA